MGLNSRALNHVHGLLRDKGLAWRNDTEAAQVLAQHATQRELVLRPKCGHVLARQIAEWVAAHGHLLPAGEGVKV